MPLLVQAESSATSYYPNHAHTHSVECDKNKCATVSGFQESIQASEKRQGVHTILLGSRRSCISWFSRRGQALAVAQTPRQLLGGVTPPVVHLEPETLGHAK